MKKITWYLNRLKAMNMGEICWRFQQKNLQKQERRKYYKENLPVYEFELPDELKNLNAQVDRISINWNNEKFTVFKEQNLYMLRNLYILNLFPFFPTRSCAKKIGPGDAM